MKRIAVLVIFALTTFCSNSNRIKVKEKESNDTIKRANDVLVSDNTLISGEISGNKDIDIYKIKAKGRSVVNIKLDYSGSSDIAIYLYNSRGRLIKYINDFSPLILSNDKRLKGSIEYIKCLYIAKPVYIKVLKARADTEGSVRYRLHIDKLDGIYEREPNDSFGSANKINIDESIRGYFIPTYNKLNRYLKEYDYFYMDIPYTQQKTMIEVELRDTPFIDSRLEIFEKGENGLNRIKLIDSNPTNFGEKGQFFTTGGRYYIRISAKRYSGNFDFPYILDVRKGYYNPDIEIEPNDNIMSANTLKIDTSREGYINNKRDIDFYRFSVDSSGEYNLYCLVIGVSGVDIALKLYDSGGNLIRYFDSTGYGGAELIPQYRIISPQSGSTFYIAVFDRTGRHFNSDEAYEIEISLLKPQMEYEREPNDSISNANEIYSDNIYGYITPDGDRDYYHIIEDTPTIIKINLGEIPFLDTVIDIYGPTNTLIASFDNNGSSIEEVAYITNTGRQEYFVCIRSKKKNQSNFENPYKLSISYLSYTPPTTTTTTTTTIIPTTTTLPYTTTTTMPTTTTITIINTNTNTEEK